MSELRKNMYNKNDERKKGNNVSLDETVFFQYY